MPKAKIKEEKKIKRQPIVVVMGHVDHGKTTFLDSIRGARVADKEHGGITQNTRTHEVTSKTGFKITFIDTPGHEAFAKMRERGAKVTDFVLLMVAADDGIQPQTKQSIEFAKENNVPIIVAINKVDLPGVNLNKIKQELSNSGVQIEEYGGDAMCFEISAKEKIGLDEVLEGIELLSEGVVAEGFVMESSLDKRFGHSAMVIMKAGSLNERAFGVTEDMIFKVRAYLDENLKPIQSVHESQPFVVTGLDKDLSTGDIINFVSTDKAAKELQDKLTSGQVSDEVVKPMDTASLFAQLLMQKQEKQQGVEQKELNIVLRASTQGTLEAVIAELNKLETEESKIRILFSGTGAVTEDDLNRAKLAKGIVIVFQTELPKQIEDFAKRNRVLVRQYEIIYNLVDELAEVLDSMDQPVEEEIEIARAKVLQIFTLSDGSQVAGCKIISGVFLKGYRVWAERNQEQLGVSRAKIKMIKQNKNEVKEVKKGMDCGLMLEPPIADLQVDDDIVAFKVEKY
jgi:translation initiation factor IF-2